LPILLDLLIYTLFSAVFVQSIYHIFIFGRFPLIDHSTQDSKKKRVSVIICAKNEADNLLKNIPHLLSQKHPDFELVLINDSSKDNTLSVMLKFKKQDSRIKIVDVKPVDAFWGNKKYALTLGIKAASNDILLFTDADCVPNSDDWVNQMCSLVTENKKLVLGYSPYQKIKGSFLNQLIRFETFMTALQYFSYAKFGQPYMAVGRNLAYKRELFFEANGFIKHIKIKSGDDDLFVNQMANKTNTALCVNPKSFVKSIPKTSFKDWVRQKRRHISTAKFYKPRHKVMLGLYYISQLLFWLSAFSLIVFLHLWKIVLIVIIFRFLVQYAVFYKSAKKLQELDLLYLLPLTELSLIVFQFYIFINNLISKPRHWK